jgi:hypothetical protein
VDIETMCFKETEVVNKFNVTLKHRKQTPVLITCTYRDKLKKLQSFYTKIDVNYTNLDNMVIDL